MPAKKAAEPQTDFIEVKITIEQAEDLLRWVGTVIKTRNANGKKSNLFCRLCGPSKQLKLKCRHTEVWQLTK